MSNTKHSRPLQLRLDDVERRALARAVMAEIESQSLANNASGGGTEPAKRYVRILRSLLERLSD